MRGFLSVDGRTQWSAFAVASPFAGRISEEWRLDECAESICPSMTWAQLHGSSTFAIATFAPGCGAHAGASNSGMVSGGPIYVQTNPPASRVGYDRCFALSG